MLRDKKNGREFILEIKTDKTMKVIKILYPETIDAESRERERAVSEFEETISLVKSKITI